MVQEPSHVKQLSPIHVCKIGLSSGANVIIWEKMISSGANVIMVSSGANVIIWCYHVMLSSGMITHPFFIFPENFTHSERSRIYSLSLQEAGFHIYVA